LHKIVEAGSQLKSFALAAAMLERLAEVPISGRHVGRLTEAIGQELRAQRDQRTEDYLHHRRAEPAVPVPEAVAVAVDGGRIMTRAQGQGRGVHEPGWREDKIACLMKLQGPTFADDPQPEPPACFCDPAYVDELARDLHAQQGLPEVESLTAAGPSLPAVPPAPAVAAERTWPPQRQQRTCVATQQESEAFGPMVAAEAYARHFYAASRRAFLADGQACNWTVHRKWFKDFVPIADFIHVLSYLYAAAAVVTGSVRERWSWYLAWMTACWQGRVTEVQAALSVWQERLGPASADLPEQDPRRVVQRARTYLGNNQSRMDYPSYRRQGLPVTSCAVESLIKEFNYRVKGTEKFWNRPDGTETILQMRAAVLSDDGRLGRHLRQRPGSPYRCAASAGNKASGKKAA
jgi:hypothetical protein